jgi:hypothetical protein
VSWRIEYTNYVLDHFRAFYEVPVDLKIVHGGAESGFEGLVINDCGKGFFANSGAVPSYGRYGDLPVLFWEEDQALWTQNEYQTIVNGDLVSAIFYFLSGWDEGNRPRVYATESSLSSCLPGWYQQPLADDYLALLAEAVSHHLGRPVPLRKRVLEGSGVFLSHDVDRLLTGKYISALSSLKKFQVAKFIRGFIKRPDVWFNIREIAEKERDYGVSSTFFFLARPGKSHLGQNADYSLKSDILKKALRDLGAFGAEIALHGSLGSDDHSQMLKEEMAFFPSALLGNRFHFLRIHPHTTWAKLEHAALSYDASLGFPDRPGFRRGTCRPFRPFIFPENRPSTIWEIPLIAMDTTFRQVRYLNCDYRHVPAYLNKLMVEVQKRSGIMSILWHNTYLSPFKFEGWSEPYWSFVGDWSSEARFWTGTSIYRHYHPLWK